MNTALNLHGSRVIQLQEMAAIELRADWVVQTGWEVDFEPLVRLLVDVLPKAFAVPARLGTSICLSGQRLAMSIFGLGACYG